MVDSAGQRTNPLEPKHPHKKISIYIFNKLSKQHELLAAVENKQQSELLPIQVNFRHMLLRDKGGVGCSCH
jgi:hypothetical protein